MFRFSCIMGLCAGLLGFQNGAGDANAERERDVYRIYSLLLTNPHTSHGADNNPRYLISEKTQPGVPEEPCVHPPPDRKAAFDEVLADFEKRRRTPRILKREFSISKPYELLNEDEVKAFRRSRFGPGQNEDPRFAGVSDLFTFSDVFFSNDGTLALTQISTWCGGLCGLWQWKVLEKTADGKWRELPWVACYTIARSGADMNPTLNSSYIR